MKKLNLYAATLLVLTSLNVSAVPVEGPTATTLPATTAGQENVKILSITSNDDESTGNTNGFTYLYLSNTTVVYIPKIDRMNTTLAISAFVSKKPVTIWTYLPTANTGGNVVDLAFQPTTATTLSSSKSGRNGNGAAPITFWKGPSIGDGTTVPALRVHRIDLLLK